MSATRTLLAGLGVACAIGACGGRPSYWDTTVSGTAASYGLTNGVALVDDPDHRVVILTALSGQDLATRSFSVGHNVATTTTSPDGNRLFLLSTGDWPRRTNHDDPPSLTVIDVSNFVPQPARYPMSVPLPNLAIDPLGHWAVAYAGSGATKSFLQNPNEIVIFDLTAPDSTPTWRTLQSFGGTPQRLTFTPPMQLPAGQRRLLVIESDIDVTLLDLDNAAMSSPPPEITVRLTSGTNAQQVAPAGVVFDSFGPHDPAHRIALRAANDSNVFTFTFGPPDAASTPNSGPQNDFKPISNLTDVGGAPTDIAFVRTDGGLRVAALVPTTLRAVLVDPDTSITTQVALPAGYTRLSLVTSVVGGTTSVGTDVAMLWAGINGATSGVALWTLGNTVGKPYFSVEVLGVSQSIQTVDGVRAPNDFLKVLESANDNSFFVLNLRSRTASPLATIGRATLSIAPDGLRLWAFARGGTDLAKLDFTNLKPVPLTTDTPIDAVYDVARPGAGGERSLIAIHTQGTVGATVFDARNPDATASRRVPALLLEGP
jgi:hypothetical protein